MLVPPTSSPRNARSSLAYHHLLFLRHSLLHGPVGGTSRATRLSTKDINRVSLCKQGVTLRRVSRPCFALSFLLLQVFGFRRQTATCGSRVSTDFRDGVEIVRCLFTDCRWCSGVENEQARPNVNMISPMHGNMTITEFIKKQSKKYWSPQFMYFFPTNWCSKRSKLSTDRVCFCRKPTSAQTIC